jgi:MbtH protein
MGRVKTRGDVAWPAREQCKKIIRGVGTMEHIQYKVVVNHEEQYALWMLHKENAAGWSDAGVAGSKEECLEYIRKVWTDMRPLSLRKAMEERQFSRSVYRPASLLQALPDNYSEACFA